MEHSWKVFSGTHWKRSYLCHFPGSYQFYIYQSLLCLFHVLFKQWEWMFSIRNISGPGAEQFPSNIHSICVSYKTYNKHTVIDKMIKHKFEDTCARFVWRRSVYQASERLKIFSFGKKKMAWKTMRNLHADVRCATSRTNVIYGNAGMPRHSASIVPGRTRKSILFPFF